MLKDIKDLKLDDTFLENQFLKYQLLDLATYNFEKVSSGEYSLNIVFKVTDTLRTHVISVAWLVKLLKKHLANCEYKINKRYIQIYFAVPREGAMAVDYCNCVLYVSQDVDLSYLSSVMTQVFIGEKGHYAASDLIFSDCKPMWDYDVSVIFGCSTRIPVFTHFRSLFNAANCTRVCLFDIYMIRIQNLI